MDELFLYLGRIGYVHMFWHVQHTEMTDDQLTELHGGVYNTMIHETMIKQNQCVIIFTLTPTKGTEGIEVYHIRHVDFEEVEFPPGDLEKGLTKALSADRDGKIFAIKAVIDSGDVKVYLSYEIDFDPEMRKDLKAIGQHEMNIKNMYNMVSRKPISYF